MVLHFLINAGFQAVLCFVDGMFYPFGDVEYAGSG